MFALLDFSLSLSKQHDGFVDANLLLSFYHIILGPPLQLRAEVLLSNVYGVSEVKNVSVNIVDIF